MGMLPSAEGNERINILNEIGHHYLHNEEWNNAKLFFQSALDLIEKDLPEVNQEELGKVRIGLSYILWKQNELDASLAEARLAIEILILARSRNLENAKRHLAVVLIAKSKYQEALSIFEEVRLNYNFDENEIQIAKDNYHIGTALKGLLDHQGAIKSLTEAKRTFMARNLVWMIMLCDMELSYCYVHIENFDVGIELGRRAFEFANFLSSYEKVLETAQMLAEFYRIKGEIDLAIFQLKAARGIYLKKESEIVSTPLVNLDNQLAKLLELSGDKDTAEEIRLSQHIFQPPTSI